MPLPLTVAARNALNAREVAHAWLLEIFTDEEVMRCWDKQAAITYETDTYEALGDQWRLASEIKLSSDLVPEPLSIVFDGGPQSDSTSFIGRLLDNTWHQRRVRVRGLLLDTSTNFTGAIGVHQEWNGFADTIETSDASGSPSVVTLNCEGGIFRARGSSLTLCTDADQKRRSASDDFMRNVALKPTQDVPFGIAWSKIPGASGRRNANQKQRKQGYWGGY